MAKEKVPCDDKSYDAIIVGGGPAGITAAIYLARRKLCVLVLYEKLGGQAALTADIENYAGFKFITGTDFTQKLEEHLEEYDITNKETKVTEIKQTKEGFLVKTKEKHFLGKTVIIGSGARQRKLRVPGEEEYLNKGVAYCATCDAPLFRGKNVAIIGGGNSALEAAIQLEKYAEKIYIITINKDLEGEKVLIDKVKSFKNSEIICCSKTKEIKGKVFVESVIIEDDKNKTKEIKVGGVFVEIGYIPNSEIFKGKKNDYKEIIIDSKNKTSIQGIFAAGDVTAVQVKQIIVAAGEGAKAAVSCAEYLNRL
ncbi:FAD-dependent oxidoreductase [Candidatus Pacearchaeota archaeon]|nr:FAD-dependent oxidoreductase [Candidatus Pacearchaeota archaeon]